MQISFKDPEFKQKLCATFLEYGIAIIQDVFDKKECDATMSEIVTCFEKLGTGVDRKDVSTWNDKTLPPNLRPGLFHSLVSHFPPVWKLRGDSRVRSIFTILHSHLRKKEIDDFLVSYDGINVRPGTIGPYHDEKSDWAHVDQTIRDRPFYCIQGQAVLTNTTACLRATPKSYKIFEHVMNLHKIKHGNVKNWCLIQNQNIDDIKATLKKREDSDAYQIPILAPAGSFIVWSSTTIHSARLPLGYQEPTSEDAWRGWRGVVYICYRPKADFSKEEQKNHVKWLEENRMTNHWGTKAFDLEAGLKKNQMKVLHTTIKSCIADPTVVYDILGKPSLTKDQAKLV